MIPTGPDPTPEEVASEFVEISLLLRGNSVEFLIRTAEVDKLEKVLMNIMSIPITENKLVKLETVIGVINFTASHLTGWVVFDNPNVKKVENP